MSTAPVVEKNRIETLDVIRGFALLGILLLNIIGFGMNSAAYTNPGANLPGTLDVYVWAGIDITAEGAMRCLFSVLFGAGVLLFVEGRQKGGWLHYKRTFWLLMFGLFDAYILLWPGDILVTYALAGLLLYLVRNVSARRLMIAAGVLIALMALMNVATNIALSGAREAAVAVAEAQDPASVSEELRRGAEQWDDFVADFELSDEAVEDEYEARRGGYASALVRNAGVATAFIFFVIPFFGFWDALAMMLLGMALYKTEVLQGARSTGFYMRLMITGFVVGLAVNVFEVSRVIASDFDVLTALPFLQPTYQIGRLGMAMGYLGLVILIVQKGLLTHLRRSLACVGRMALTNYLMHSLLCIFIFTGAGLALVGELTRAELYLVVAGIWLLQMLLSPWWLKRYQFGPLEWLWRGLTYGRWPPLRRADAVLRGQA